jgi:hypothetical protein
MVLRVACTGTGGKASLWLRHILKHVFERLVEHLGNPKGHLQRWRVLAALDRVHRLPGDADLIGEFLLRHLPVVEPKGSDLIVDSGLCLAHFYIPRR